jgi:prepilin-type N-terminal cleavage/methylation domain-containing protein
MNGRRLWGQRLRPGLTLVELLVAIAVLGLLEALLLTTHAPAPRPTLLLAAPTPAPLMPAGGELSLQTTLDRLGFTVNVPREYEGLPLDGSRPGRVSTRSDALPSGWFEADGPVQFLEVSRQSNLGSVVTFAAETAGGSRTGLFSPGDSTGGYWSTPQPDRDGSDAPELTPRRATCEIHGRLRFSLEFPTNPYNPGSLFSTGEDNPDGVSHVLVLPARKGGTWVDEGPSTGHWEGGVEDGTYLLCWEDAVHGDNDFQDLVVYASGIRPARR